MKKLLTAILAAGTLVSAQAQLFSPEAFGGAAWGALLGGIIGGDSYGHHGHCHSSFSGEGAAIGAGIGLLAGALAGEARRNSAYDSPTYVSASAPTVSLGYGYTSGGSSAYVYYAPNAYTAPGYYYRPARPNYAVGGTLLGAASGALIGAGNNQAGEGAAIGAAAGLVVGGIAEATAKKREQRAVVATQTTPTPTTPIPNAAESQPAPQPQVTSQPSAESTYYWTPRPQIADAPRVPDAPTF
jgi:uncharacterized protein YcfJ